MYNEGVLQVISVKSIDIHTNGGMQGSERGRSEQKEGGKGMRKGSKEVKSDRKRKKFHHKALNIITKNANVTFNGFKEYPNDFLNENEEKILKYENKNILSLVSDNFWSISHPSTKSLTQNLSSTIKQPVNPKVSYFQLLRSPYPSVHTDQSRQENFSLQTTNRFSKETKESTLTLCMG